MNHKALDRLEVLRRLNGSNRNWVNKDLYRLLYKEELYIVAYEKIKSKPGNMTPGTDHSTIDGFSMKIIEKIINDMRTEVPRQNRFFHYLGKLHFVVQLLVLGLSAQKSHNLLFIGITTIHSVHVTLKDKK